jgi:hypothetical protein
MSQPQPRPGTGQAQTLPWYLRTGRERYMSQADQDATVGRLHRECAELERAVALFESKLKVIGEEMVHAGQILRDAPSDFRGDKAVITAAVGEIWELVEKLNDAGATLADKRAEMTRLSWT